MLYINKYTYDQICSIPKLKGFLAVVLFVLFSWLSNINYLLVYSSSILMFTFFFHNKLSSFIYLFINQFIYLFIYLFYIYLIIYVFIYLFILWFW